MHHFSVSKAAVWRVGAEQELSMASLASVKCCQ